MGFLICIAFCRVRGIPGQQNSARCEVGLSFLRSICLFPLLRAVMVLRGQQVRVPVRLTEGGAELHSEQSGQQQTG